MPIQVRRCPFLHTYDVLVMGGRDVGNLDINGPAEGCPECGATTYERMVGSVSLPGINAYPYFDRGLGLTVESAEHKRRVLAERGLVELGADAESVLSAQKRAGAPAKARAARAKENQRVLWETGGAEIRKEMAEVQRQHKEQAYQARVRAQQRREALEQSNRGER